MQDSSSSYISFLKHMYIVCLSLYTSMGDLIIVFKIKQYTFCIISYINTYYIFSRVVTWHQTFFFIMIAACIVG